MFLQQQVINEFQQRYGEAPTHIVRAPGRVNLIGEHTDYNDGFVMPMAIERAVYVALRPSQNSNLSVYLMDFDQTITLDISQPLERGDGPVEYIKGVTQALLDRGIDLRAWEGVAAGNVPIGAGLSSSAALEMAVLYAYQAVSGFELDRPDRPKLGQWVENEWLGVASGIMDQTIVVYGKAGKAIMIDCRNLDTTEVTLPVGTAVAILDTGTRRTLDGSAYNERRQQCETAAAFYGVPKLRDLDLETFEARAGELEDLPRRRARHVLTENARVLAAKDAADAGDAVKLGQLMDESHVSMRDDFEISSDALNAIVTHARKHPACYGARMTGGGFAGCAVALIRAEDAAQFAETVATGYADETGNEPQVYITLPTDGAEIIPGA